MKYKKIIVQQSATDYNRAFLFQLYNFISQLYETRRTYACIYFIYVALSKTLMREFCAAQRLKKLLCELVRAL